MMDYGAIVLWRHADAGRALDDPRTDVARELTPVGTRQAENTARWLRKRLPSGWRLMSSPAPRAMQTAQHLGEPLVDQRLAPGASLEDHLALLDESHGGLLIVVGHQPVLGMLAARLLGCDAAGAGLAMRKSSAWCLSRVRQEPGVARLEGIHTPALDERLRRAIRPR